MNTFKLTFDIMDISLALLAVSVVFFYSLCFGYSCPSSSFVVHKFLDVFMMWACKFFLNWPRLGQPMVKWRLRWSQWCWTRWDVLRFFLTHAPLVSAVAPLSHPLAWPWSGPELARTGR